LALLALLLAGIALVRPWRSPVADSPVSLDAPPLPALAASPYGESMREATYSGSEVCAECHSQEHASYLETAHSQSFSLVDAGREPPDGQFTHPEKPRHYASYRAHGELRHREFLATAAGEVTLIDRPLKYLVGSGRFSRTYLAELDGFLVESPLTWYASLAAWQLSPGFEDRIDGSFSRSVSANCLYCHVGQLERAGGSDFRMEVHELAISCERCHGPGSRHVARRRLMPEDAGDNLIVNPRKLSRELAEAICQQCHLESKSSVEVRGRRREDFRPGQRWTDFVVNYAADSPPSDMTVTGHVQQMHASRCYQASDDLTCTTCHDPHDSPSPAERADYYRQTCSKCHDDGSCGLLESERIARNQNHCAACHMPQSPTDIPHIAFTHHRIGIHQANPPPVKVAEPTGLVPVLDVAHLPQLDQQRNLGLAYLQLVGDHAGEEGYRALEDRARELLQQAVAGGIRDPAVQTAMALLDVTQGDVAAARGRAESALSASDIAPVDRATAIQLLARLDLRENRLPAARERLEQLVRLWLAPEDWFLLGLCRQRQGDGDGAIAAFEKVLEIDPGEPGTYRSLIPLYEARGAAEKARRARETLQLLETARSPAAN
jgi:predicted CXXCH cytochrome family protein